MLKTAFDIILKMEGEAVHFIVEYSIREFRWYTAQKMCIMYLVCILQK